MRKTKIYSDCYQISLYIFNRVKSFPRPLRVTLGRKLEEATLECLLGIRRAEVYKGERRLKNLYFVSDALDELRTLIQLSYDLKAINSSALSEVMTLTKEVGRELGGFIKFEKGNYGSS